MSSFLRSLLRRAAIVAVGVATYLLTLLWLLPALGLTVEY